MSLKIRPTTLCIWCAIALQLALAAVLVLWNPAPAAAQDLSAYMEGMNPDQVSKFMEVAQKVTCPCGCGRGTLMQCRLTDPNCPVSPQMLKTAATLIKADQSVDSVVSSLANAKPNRPTPPPTPQPAAGSIALEVGDSPTMGPKDAKVTILEFSDFQ